MKGFLELLPLTNFMHYVMNCVLLEYYRLMAEKSKELGDAANKLKNGLEKIDDTRQKVC